ncbi:MAG: nucleotidyltransferase substrate binding protein, partial [Clostridia bacterium]|nr:nucleotidyltransferase substrate binding protein [Deltaproteobacteria bacterium]
RSASAKKAFSFMADDTSRTLANAERSLATLERFTRAEVNEISRAAVIQAFEFTFEAVWKAFAKRAAQEGDSAPSPKRAMSRAFHYGIIEDESVWLRMLEDRNLTVHTYNESLAQAIYERVVHVYLPAFTSAFARLRSST